MKVKNALPSIDDIILEANITEGTETIIEASAADNGNDTLTYNWEFVGANRDAPQQEAEINYTFPDNR